METIKTSGSIITTIVTDAERKHCYEVEKTCPELQGKVGIIIGLYPTQGSLESDVFSMDKSTLHLMQHLQELGLRSVKIINLFSRIVKGSRMSTRNLLVDTPNLQYIQELMQKPDFKEALMIVSFGSSMSTSLACNQSKEELFKLFRKYNPSGKIFQLTSKNLATKNNSATHLLYMGIRFGNVSWYIEEYKIPTELQGENIKDTSEVKKTASISYGKEKSKKVITLNT